MTSNSDQFLTTPDGDEKDITQEFVTNEMKMSGPGPQILGARTLAKNGT